MTVEQHDWYSQILDDYNTAIKATNEKGDPSFDFDKWKKGFQDAHGSALTYFETLNGGAAELDGLKSAMNEITVSVDDAGSIMDKVKGAAKGLFTSIGSALKSIGTGLMDAGISLAVNAIIVGLVKAGQAFYEFYSGATARNNLSDAVGSWEDTTDEITSLNTELETTQARIDELQAQGQLSLTEEQELTQLQLQNDELERQLKLKEQIAEAQYEVVKAEADNSLNAEKTFDFELNQGGNPTGETARMTTQEAVNRYLDEIEQMEKEKAEFQDKLYALTPGTEEYDLYADGYQNMIADYEDAIGVTKDSLSSAYSELSSLIGYFWNESTGEIDTGYEQIVQDFKDSRTRMDSLLGQTASSTTSAINTLFAKKDFADIEEQLLNAGKTGSSAIKEVISATPELQSALEDAGIQVDDLVTHFTALANAGEYNLDEVTDQLKKAYGGASVEGSTLDVYRRSQMGKLLSSLSDSEITDLYEYVNSNGIDLSQLNLEDVRQLVVDIKVNNQEALLDIEDVNASTTELLSTVSSVNELLNSRTEGTSITAETFNDETLADYAEALEYVNGTYQLNEEKVQELTKAKVEEQIATNDARKALQQQRYSENAKEIAEYTAKLESGNFAAGETAESIQALISSHEEENAAIVAKCTQLDLMNANLRESIGIYEQWKNAQNASNTGDMFDDAQTAWQEIRDVADNESETYGRVGRQQYQASVDFLVPETVDHTDQKAVQKYLDSIRKWMTFDDDGNINGLDINNFLSSAVKKGLMVKEDGFYKTNGKLSLEEFAEGMNASLPLVQAIFGEIEEFMPEGSEWFDWEEPVQTLGDLATVANDAASALSAAGMAIDLDLSEFETAEEQVDYLESTIKQLQDYKTTMNLDSSQIQQANDIIQYCVQHIQMLESPVIMQVDTSLVDGALGTTIDLLQQFQTLQEQREAQVAIGADTTAIDEEIAAVVESIKGQKPKILAQVGIDPNSTIDATTISDAISQISLESLVTMLPNTDAIIGYNPDEESPKTATVYYQVNDTAVQQYNPDNLTRYVYYHVQTVGDVPSGSSSGAHSLNGTAHAGGNWGTKTSSTALVGELGREIIVNPYTGKWYTVGDNGPEFTQIPKGSIVFNHLQTEELLSKGFVATRGMALAGGNAFANTGSVGINIPVASVTDAKTQRKDQSGAEANTKATNKNTAATQANTDSNENLYDWIERMVTSFERTLQRYETLLSDETNWAGLRDSLRELSISAINSQLPQYQQAYEYYMAKANSVGLPDNYKTLAENGLINIEEITDETLRQQIENFEAWLTKARELDDTIVDLNIQLKELKMQKLDDIMDSTDTLTSYHQSIIDMLDASQEVLITKGEKAVESVYQSYMNQYNAQRQYYALEAARLENELDKLVDDGTIVKYSEKWAEYKANINEAKQNLYEVNQAIAETQDTILELRWSYFEDGITAIENMKDSLSGLADLIDDTMAFVKGTSTLSGLGFAKIGLIQNQMTQAKQAIANYGQAIDDLNELYAKGYYSESQYEEKLAELRQTQLDYASDLKNLKDSIIDLVKEGINREVDAMKELVDARQEALDKQREYYDFNEKMKDQTSEINSIEAQIQALRGNDSVEAQTKLRQLESQKRELEEELAKTQREHEQDVISQGYDDFMEEFEQNADDYMEELDSSLEAQNKAIESLLNDVSSNSETVFAYLNELANEYGLNISENITDVWKNAQSAVEDYQKAAGLVTVEPNTSVNTGAIKGETTGWQNGVYMNSDGTIATNQWISENGKEYYVGADGKKVTGTPIINGKKYVFNSNGEKQSGWQSFNGWTLYADPSDNGAVATGIREIGGKTYLFDSNGVQYTGSGTPVVNGKKYFVQNGVVKSGWQKLGNWTMYFDPTTYQAVTGKRVIDGIEHLFDSNGIMKYNSGAKYTKNGWAFIDDDENGNLALGSEAIITDNGVLMQMNSGSTVFNKDQKDFLYELSKAAISAKPLNLDSVITPAYLNNSARANTGSNETNIHYDSIIGNIEYVDKNALPELETIVKKSFDYTVKELRKQQRKL